MRFSDFVLLLNALWFGGAFIQFSIAQHNTLKILVPREERGNPIARRRCRPAWRFWGR